MKKINITEKTAIQPAVAKTRKLIVPPAEPVVVVADVIRQLTPEEAKALKECEGIIEREKTAAEDSFREMAKAFRRIQSEQLYVGTHPTFEKYVAARWKYGRSQAYRIAGAGRLINRLDVSPHGDSQKLLTSEAQFRPLATLNEPEQDAVVEKVQQWSAWRNGEVITPKLVNAAATIVNPPTPPAQAGEKANAVEDMAAKFVEIVKEARETLPKPHVKEIDQIFNRLEQKALALGNPARRTGIDWTEATWNPLSGCTRASKGCDFCYAAKLMATRMAGKYPGLATKTDNGHFAFTGVIQCHPEKLADPLQDRIPKKYFVNSMSDLFHKDVPEKFITAVFDVMEKAHWHKFQVLTKRPERMAEFTQKRYKDRQAPSHIWLGTSTEDQQNFDERIKHLRQVKAAVRWLSCEPLLGPIKFDSMSGIDWVVVGGESGSKRPMAAAWVRSIRDACAKDKVAFFFKQWGVNGEDGKKLKKKKKDGLTPMATLDGAIHNEAPKNSAQAVQADKK